MQDEKNSLKSVVLSFSVLLAGWEEAAADFERSAADNIANAAGKISNRIISKKNSNNNDKENNKSTQTLPGYASAPLKKAKAIWLLKHCLSPSEMQKFRLKQNNHVLHDMDVSRQSLLRTHLA